MLDPCCTCPLVQETQPCQAIHGTQHRLLSVYISIPRITPHCLKLREYMNASHIGADLFELNKDANTLPGICSVIIGRGKPSLVSAGDREYPEKVALKLRTELWVGGTQCEPGKKRAGETFPWLGDELRSTWRE